MAIKFSAKDQPARAGRCSQSRQSRSPRTAPKPAASADTANDLFKSPAEAPKGKAGKKK